ncbi:hypothetical protein Q4596_06610 [Pseudoalteromonas carrageenovora]|uniref:hypothetical protein n=1 Tax=Pseudoalteromonas carrageenovora TaxID=227 RepID=UPI0026E18E23|nr:hypothetical protein [Pseudoalteromonas carrageenovora]MDO6835288.1 hypothetical protein [Pseudoalteromonas carrageenovora]
MIEFQILEKTPKCAKDKTHYYCDYMELIALSAGTDGISSSDIYDRYQEDERITEIGTQTGAESNEAWMSDIENWFLEIVSRIEAYGDKYPFTYTEGRLIICQNMTENQLMYVGLLLCSSLRYIGNSSAFSSAFEYASLCAMKKYLPSYAEVHIFGVSSHAPRYTGSLRDKIQQLSRDISFPVSSRPNVFREVDNGDGGIDIVAWLPFQQDTNLDKKLLFVGQSAATMDWGKKQSSVDRLKTYLDIETSLLNVLYVPFDMRDVDRNIREWTLVTTDILFDRHRLLGLLDPNDLFSGVIGENFKVLIESAVRYEEDIV